MTSDGTETVEWPVGKWHRRDGPSIEHVNGHKEYYVNGRRHRLDGPAMELASGTKAWWVHDKLHRLDGPAIENYNGSREWYINGQELTEQQWTLEVCRRMRDA